jgi:hypothetical protein
MRVAKAGGIAKAAPAAAKSGNKSAKKSSKPANSKGKRR